MYLIRLKNPVVCLMKNLAVCLRNMFRKHLLLMHAVMTLKQKASTRQLHPLQQFKKAYFKERI